MRHFHHLDAELQASLFAVPPEEFDRDAERDLLAVALGATLYTPATRSTIERDVIKVAGRGVMCSVLCLEDAIADADVDFAEKNLAHALSSLFVSGASRPLVFVRVRHPDQAVRLVDALGPLASELDGFVLPKFTAQSVPFLEAVDEASRRAERRFWVMPVLESPDVFGIETRAATLVAAKDLLRQHAERVLAVRIGATDLSSMLALRRPPDITAYDVVPLASAIGDIVNVLGRHDGTGFVVTGPVWEHYDGPRMFKPQLRETPFTAPAEQVLRRRLIRKGLDGLIREVALDQANGMLGKTVIHPSHVAAVHALSVVSSEDHADALDITAARSRGGVSASRYGNKMNEATPHLAWATATLLRARAFGVAAEDVSFVDLLEAGVRR